MQQNRDKREFVIRKKISLSLKLRDLLLTLTLWGLWIYLFYPLFGLILWKLWGVNIFFYYETPAEINALEVKLNHFLKISGGVIALIVFAVLWWGNYNQRKFNHYKNKRKGDPTPISTEMMAKALHTSPEIISTAKEAKYVQFYHTHESPKDLAKVFKEVKCTRYKCVNIVFSDNWEQIRQSSNFGYTHKQQLQKEEIAR